ncbi:hypothetical protein [Thauera sp. WH-1]|uniref:hypothetical protein n=1 Tax=Thauera sp. WH-1 TaxID=3398230 RepID=UPI0039FCC5A0
MSNQRTHGGLYLVTLNNETPISVNAGDHRVAQRAIQVRRGDIKVGKSEHLTKRHGNYVRNFGRDHVNFSVLAYIPGGKSDRDRAESVVFECFRPFRIRGTTGRLNEWMNGVSASDARAMALEALRDSGIEHLVVPEEGDGSADTPPMAVVGQVRATADRNRKANRRGGATASDSPTNGYAQQTIMHIDFLDANDVLDGQTFKRLHHRSSVSAATHRSYCAERIARSGDFDRGVRGEPNRNVCRRLGLIADALSARVPPVSRDEIEVLIRQALREFPL